MRHRDIQQQVQSALDDQGLTAHGAAVKAGLPESAIRRLLEGRSPRTRRMMAICEALGLEFYIGPPRPQSRSSVIGNSGFDVVAAAAEVLESLATEGRTRRPMRLPEGRVIQLGEHPACPHCRLGMALVMAMNGYRLRWRAPPLPFPGMAEPTDDDDVGDIPAPAAMPLRRVLHVGRCFRWDDDRTRSSWRPECLPSTLTSRRTPMWRGT